MSDQHVVSDWRVYFAEYMARWAPYTGPATVPYVGWGTFRLVWVHPVTADLETVELAGEENPFVRAQEVWEANEGPEMWLFGNPGGPPWHVDAKPRVKKKGR